MDANILKKAQFWATSPLFDAATRAEIQGFLTKNDEEALADRFFKDLSFGTGGMRGIMGAGSCRMNVYNIRRATSAFAIHLAKVHGQKSLKVAISYDSRNNSKLYAQTAAARLAAHGIKVLITKEMRPVPLLSFMVRHFGCEGGICLTASHNPPVYNGYKVFWQDGGQLTPPHDEDIVKVYNELSYDYPIADLSYEEALAKDLVLEVGTELDEAYYKTVLGLSLQKEGRDQLNIVYSPLHGTGIFVVPELIKRFGFTNIAIPEAQAKPDGNFPTVEFPNPEDPKALVMALELAKKNKADIVLATDPDTDRIGIISRDKDGTYVRFDGNQIISLLAYYILSRSKSQNKLMPNSYVVSTVVTGTLFEKIGAHFGVECIKTLTGFKWIAGALSALEKTHPEKVFVCGGEESFGFLPGAHVRDKDAVISCALACEMAAYYKSQGKTLVDVLDDIFMTHGCHIDDLITMTLEGEKGQRRIAEIMHNFRHNLPQKIAGFAVQSCIDYESLQKISAGKKEPLATELPSSDVLEFSLEQNIRFSIRPSGTEPKIKIYVSLFSAPPHSRSELKEEQKRLLGRKDALVKALKEAWA